MQVVVFETRWYLLQFLTIPPWIGEGTLPVAEGFAVVVALVGVLGLWSIVDTQAHALAHSPVQPVSIDGFHFRNSAPVMEYLEAI